MTNSPIPLPNYAHLISKKASEILTVLPRKGVPLPVSQAHVDAVLAYMTEAQDELAQDPSDKKVFRGFQEAVNFQTTVLNVYDADSKNLEDVVKPEASNEETPTDHQGKTSPCVYCNDRGLSCVLASTRKPRPCRNCRNRHMKCIAMEPPRSGAPNPIQTVDSHTLYRPRKRIRFDNFELPSSPPQTEASSSRGSGRRVAGGPRDVSHQSTILITPSEEGLLRTRDDFFSALEDLKEELNNSTSTALSELYALAKVWQLREDLLLGL